MGISLLQGLEIFGDLLVREQLFEGQFVRDQFFEGLLVWDQCTWMFSKIEVWWIRKTALDIELDLMSGFLFILMYRQKVFIEIYEYLGRCVQIRVAQCLRDLDPRIVTSRDWLIFTNFLESQVFCGYVKRLCRFSSLFV